MSGVPCDRPVGVAIRSGRRLFRDALASCLAGASGFTVLGHVDGDADLMRLCELCCPDIVLFDAGARLAPSLGALGALRSWSQRVRLVVIYERLSPGEVDASWRLGVDTWVPCSHGLDAMFVVLRQQAKAVRAHRGARSHNGLTDREQEIVALVAAGHTAHRIADLLGVGDHAVENEKRRIYQKLGAACQSHAIARAAALGLIDRPQPGWVKPSPVGGPILVRLRGPDGPARSAVMVALLAGSIPFVFERSDAVFGVRGNGGVRVGPVLEVLVDPQPEDWMPGTATPILVVRSNSLRRGETARALAGGASAVLCADQVDEMLVPVLRFALSGHVVVDRAGAGELLAGGGIPELTVRESEILRSIDLGHTVRQTARHLGIAEKTVENTQSRLFRKLGVRNRAGAAAAAYASGLLESASSDADGESPSH